MQVRELNRCGGRIGFEGEFSVMRMGFSGSYTGLGFARVIRVSIDLSLALQWPHSMILVQFRTRLIGLGGEPTICFSVSSLTIQLAPSKATFTSNRSN